MQNNDPRKRSEKDTEALEETRTSLWPRLWYRLGVSYRREPPMARTKTSRPAGGSLGSRRSPFSAFALGTTALATLALLVVVFVHMATATANADKAARDERTEDESPALNDPLYREAEPDPTRRPLKARNHFTLHPADPGALSYEDLNEEEKVTLDAARDWAELSHGDDVHAAYRTLSQKRSAKAKAASAEQAIGLRNRSLLGVTQ